MKVGLWTPWRISSCKPQPWTSAPSSIERNGRSWPRCRTSCPASSAAVEPEAPPAGGPNQPASRSPSWAMTTAPSSRHRPQDHGNPPWQAPRRLRPQAQCRPRRAPPRRARHWNPSCPASDRTTRSTQQRRRAFQPRPVLGHPSPAGQPSAPEGDLAARIDTSFGSLDALKSALRCRRLPVRVRMGMARQVCEPDRLFVCSTAKPGNPLMSGIVDPDIKAGPSSASTCGSTRTPELPEPPRGLRPPCSTASIGRRWRGWWHDPTAFRQGHPVFLQLVQGLPSAPHGTPWRWG